MRKKNFMKATGVILSLSLVISLVGCGGSKASSVTGAGTASEEVTFAMEAVPLTESAPISTTLMPKASGVTVLGNDTATIDASNKEDGYVMINCKDKTDKRKKVLIKGPSGTQYTYNIMTPGSYEVFPLSDGNGSYTIGVYKNTQDTKYAALYTTTVQVTLKDQFAPFLLPNQYVNYKADSQVVKTAAQLVQGKKTDLEKIQAVYDYVVKNFTYDKQKASTVQSGYLPNVDSILAAKKGICFDYAAVMTAMLRSQNIPTKLVIGNAGDVYHAWINTYSEEGGWMDSVIYFDGNTWKLMDPTFASSGKSSDSIMKYIGDGSNYSAKYLY